MVDNFAAMMEEEQTSYDSLSLLAEMKLNEARAKTEGLNEPNALRTAVACEMLCRVGSSVGRFEPLMATLLSELLPAIYGDYAEQARLAVQRGQENSRSVGRCRIAICFGMSIRVSVAASSAVTSVMSSGAVWASRSNSAEARYSTVSKPELKVRAARTRSSRSSGIGFPVSTCTAKRCSVSGWSSQCS